MRSVLDKDTKGINESKKEGKALTCERNNYQLNLQGLFLHYCCNDKEINSNTDFVHICAVILKVRMKTSLQRESFDSCILL